MAAFSTPATIPVLIGVPDDGQVKIDPAGDTAAPRLVIPGTAAFLNYLPEPVQRRLPVVHCGADGRFSRGTVPLPRVVANLAADPDVAGRALRAMARAIGQAGSRCFNHPGAVLMTGRHDVATRLAGIPGLAVPKAVRVRLDAPEDLQAAVEAAGLHWPVIVRVAGVHSGGTTVRIDRAGDAAASLSTIPWGGRTLYVTQYVPYADADGWHRKLRIVVVGQEAFLRHEVTGASWQMHAGDHDPRFNDAERERVERFAADTLPLLRDRLRAISDTMQLDFFGLDCSLRPDGGLLVFECNAAMNVMREKRMMATYAGSNHNRPEHVRTWQATVRRIHDALLRLLFDPSQWRHTAAIRGTGMAR